jgi:predicted transcriptional regulator YdeE
MKFVPEIVRLPERQFVGLQSRFISSLSPEANNREVIPRLWSEFSSRSHEVETSEPGVFYGLCACPATLGEVASRPDEAIYLAAVQVAKGAAAPAGMATWISSEGVYAKFVHRGRIEGLDRTMGYIYGEWLPQGPYAHADAADIERYGPEFDPHGEASVLEIYIPVRVKV